MSYPYLIEYSHILYEPIFKSERPAIILFSNDPNGVYNHVFEDAAR